MKNKKGVSNFYRYSDFFFNTKQENDVVNQLHTYDANNCNKAKKRTSCMQECITITSQIKFKFSGIGKNNWSGK